MEVEKGYVRGNYYWRDPFLTSMIMVGSVTPPTPPHYLASPIPNRIVMPKLEEKITKNGYKPPIMHTHTRR